MERSQFYVNLTVYSGQKIAIVEKNGLGKFTFIKMLMKYNNYEGSIIIDNEDLKFQSEGHLQNWMSYVQQDAPLFNDTVRYGNAG